MKSKLSLLLLSVFLIHASIAQNCSNPPTGYLPINDLGTGYWQGAQGGLYPNGSNYKPSFHNQQGLAIASQMQPLDTSGAIDPVNGKIVWLSIGMSNTTMETQTFIPMADTFAMKNPKLILIDGAQGGQVINQRLALAGLTAAQVQAVWFKQAQKMPADTSFASYPDTLKNKFRTGIQIIKTKFPNSKLCYLSSRIYAGYATGPLNPEPYAYYSGWSVKRLIEDQVNGDTSLAYSGANIRAPWLAWGPYTWADGTTPRSDSLTWICPADYNSDGTHPSPQGRQKVAQMLFNFFTTDSTSTPWFLAPVTSGLNELSESAGNISIYPNPAKDVIKINIAGIYDGDAVVKNIFGETIYLQPLDNANATFDVKSLSPGFYFVMVRTNQKLLNSSFVKL